VRSNHCIFHASPPLFRACSIIVRSKSPHSIDVLHKKVQKGFTGLICVETSWVHIKVWLCEIYVVLVQIRLHMLTSKATRTIVVTIDCFACSSIHQSEMFAFHLSASALIISTFQLSIKDRLIRSTIGTIAPEPTCPTSKNNWGLCAVFPMSMLTMRI